MRFLPGLLPTKTSTNSADTLDDTKKTREELAQQDRISGTVAPWQAKGSRLTPWGRGESKGTDNVPRITGSPTSTPDAEILTAALVQRPTGDMGTLIGRDVLSHALVAHDPFTAYKEGVITSPAVICMGDVGAGKSSFLKTWAVMRPLIHQGKRVVVIDKKDERGEGEYSDLTRMFNVEPLQFRLEGGGTILNPMDPVITGEERQGGARVLRALAEIAGGRPLDEWENKALRLAFSTTMSKFDTKRTPTLPDILTALRSVADTKGLSLDARTRDRLAEAGVTVSFMLDRLVDEYPNLFDGETTKDVSLKSKLTVFDVSQLPSAGPAVDAVVGVTNHWLLGTLRRDRGKATNLVIEEGWHLIDGPNAQEWKEKIKLARGLALSLVISLHKPADIDPASPAMTIIQEAQTVVLYRNSRREDARRCKEIFDLNEGAEDVLMSLPTGQHLLKIGTHPESWIRHIRSDLEVNLTNTDSAMMASESREEATQGGE